MEGVKLARTDATVARVIPIYFWKTRDDINIEKLERVARERGEKQAVGFFLDLTALLSSDRRLSEWSNRFRDHRFRTHDFFETPATRFTEALAEKRTPDVARKWGFKMNMELSSFESQFRKFVDG